MQRSNIAIITLTLFALSMAFWLDETNINQASFLTAQKGILPISDIQETDTYRLKGSGSFIPISLFIQIGSIHERFYQALKIGQAYSILNMVTVLMS